MIYKLHLTYQTYFSECHSFVYVCIYAYGSTKVRLITYTQLVSYYCFLIVV